MKKKRFTDEQIIGVIKEHGSGVKVDDHYRRMGICLNPKPLTKYIYWQLLVLSLLVIFMNPTFLASNRALCCRSDS